MILEWFQRLCIRGMIVWICFNIISHCSNEFGEKWNISVPFSWCEPTFFAFLFVNMIKISLLQLPGQLYHNFSVILRGRQKKYLAKCRYTIRGDETTAKNTLNVPVQNFPPLQLQHLKFLNKFPQTLPYWQNAVQRIRKLLSQMLKSFVLTSLR